MNTSILNCSICGGSGYVRAQQGFFAVERPCPACNLNGARPKSETAQHVEKATIKKSGYVYILLLSAGILKIGHTRKHPEDRASQWSLQLLAYARAEDSAAAERRMHEYLAAYRQGKYELFEMSFSHAIEALERIVGSATIVRRP